MEPLRVRAADAAPYRAVQVVLACCSSRMPMIGSVMLVETEEGGDVGMWLDLFLDIGTSGIHFSPDRLLAVERPGAPPVVHRGRLLDEDAEAAQGEVLRIRMGWSSGERLFESRSRVTNSSGSGQCFDEDYDQVVGLWIAAAPEVPWGEIDRLVEDARGKGTTEFRFGLLMRSEGTEAEDRK